MHRRGGWALVAAVLISVFLYAGSAEAAASKAPKGPGIRSNAAYVMDTATGNVLYERKSDLVGPIASITKLMTALVVLEGGQPLDEIIEIKADDRWRATRALSRALQWARS